MNGQGGISPRADLTDLLMQPPPGFLEPIVISSPTPAKTAPAKAKYPSLIERLGLQSQATAQDEELAGPSSGVPLPPSFTSTTADTGMGKGKGKMREDKAWIEMSVQEKKEAMVLDARRYVLSPAHYTPVRPKSEY